MFNQYGFDVDSNTGRADHANLWLSNLGNIDLKYHRPLPDGIIKQVILRGEKSGKWYASVVIDCGPDYPEKPAAKSIKPKNTVGFDIGIFKFIHDSDENTVVPLDETRDRKRIE